MKSWTLPETLCPSELSERSSKMASQVCAKTWNSAQRLRSTELTASGTGKSHRCARSPSLTPLTADCESCLPPKVAWQSAVMGGSFPVPEISL